ncbi:phage repressor protein CI [Vibrio parahaemolyticus]|uniref:phage repressor protein CI n=1 Tax=Vibrio parahaemolyticus TaxID=670 RepID=UPI00111DB91A|nr:phage repressor protein CI [Vibrio parahaemolyticus]MDG2666519.1 phage repressor protein CI [Vibrio parahaemolyticus]TOC37303.1 chromosome partitioning protein ParA [Vibrio parahaemolyticus]
MDKIPPFDYLKGEAFTDKLKEVTGCKTLLEMSERFDVPKATFSAWNTHERTSHELMVRLHLALGVPIEELALKPEDRDKVRSSDAAKKAATYHSAERLENPQHSSVIIKSYCLTNGKLLDTGEVPYSVRRINGFGLENADLIEIETNQSVVLVDKKENDAMNGNYLIGIDGRHSINQIQRLPGKLAIAFDGQTIEVQDGDIEVIGKVVLETKLK